METTKKVRLKLNPDNTINIKSIKDSWTREETANLIRNFRNEILIEISARRQVSDFTEKWIETNL